MRLVLATLWICDVFQTNSIWSGWFWPLAGWLVIPHITTMIAMRWLFPDLGSTSIWIIVYVCAAVCDILEWNRGDVK